MTGHIHGVARRRRYVSLALLLASICCVSGVRATGSLALEDVEREVVARSHADGPSQSAVDTGSGSFSESVTAAHTESACLPLGIGCITIGWYDAAATQESLVATGADGALVVRSNGTVDTSSMGSTTGTAEAVSALRTSFYSAGDVGFELAASGSGPVSVTLEGPDGDVFVIDDLSTGIELVGALAEGRHVLVVEALASGTQAAAFDVDLAVRPGESPPDLVCTVALDRLGYTPGETVVATTLEVANRATDPLPIELKIWHGSPGGDLVSIRNDGTDAQLGMPAQTRMNFGPVALVPLGADAVAGVHEIGCRMLNPLNGELLAEDVTLFEVMVP